MNITVRFWPDAEPEVFIDGALSEWVAAAALYRAAEQLDVEEIVESDSTSDVEEDE